MQTRCSETGQNLAGSTNCYSAEIVGAIDKLPLSARVVEKIPMQVREQAIQPGKVRINFAFFLQDSFEMSEFAFCLSPEMAARFLPKTYKQLVRARVRPK